MGKKVREPGVNSFRYGESDLSEARITRGLPAPGDVSRDMAGRSAYGQLFSSVRKQAFQSNFLSGLLRLIRSRALPKFLVYRAVANGLIREELNAAFKQARSWEQLPQVFAGIAGELTEKAVYWDDLGLMPRASSYYLQAALWDFYAQLLSGGEPDRKALLYARCSKNYRLATQHFEYPAQAVQIPYQAGSLRGYLRLPGPEATRPYPCTILIGGVNSSKEELHFTENAFLRMGIATLSFDLPGFGESLGNRLDNCDFEILGNALYLFLTQQVQLNPDRLALHGISLGGSLALHMVRQCPNRYRAVATLSAPYNLRVDLKRLMPPVRREVVCLTSGAEHLLRDFAAKLYEPEALADLTCPILVAGGGKDIIVRGSETKLLYERSGSPDKKLLYCPNAGHGCYEMIPSLRYEIAQWIRQRI